MVYFCQRDLQDLLGSFRLKAIISTSSNSSAKSIWKEPLCCPNALLVK
ncbi:hypothetical protein F383_09475 [Gossypium arboreum]|uniref:Uncharacterized protein n=1 Tax=Gossypium arboreum TaxID=29729 RepID=A0A0B0P6E1_GOSAR|nr:hypothetical protein F383_09475 [Gossypium arboreum]